MSRATPGVDLIDWRAEPHRFVLLAVSPPGKEIHLPHTAIRSAFGLDDPSRLVIETEDIRQGVASVYETNPRHPRSRSSCGTCASPASSSWRTCRHAAR
ncbi:hypothetical protein [Streptomyces peucetius]|nr:hypothetical protein CGZ69_35445 [Streptomyces peucetius subsp. caesius ATCC 27952]